MGSEMCIRDSCTATSSDGGGVQTVGAGTVRFRFERIAATPLALCYAFGERPFVYAPLVNVTVADLTEPRAAVTVVIGQRSRLHFAGPGVRDGDVAKFISTSFSCAFTVDQLLGGAVTIRGGVADFNFQTTSDMIVLCYKFGDQPYKRRVRAQIPSPRLPAAVRSRRTLA